MALRTLVVTVTLLLLSNCVPFSPEHDHTIDIVYDPCVPIDVRPAEDTTIEELAAIDSAMELWKAVANIDISRDRPGAVQTLDVRFKRAAPVFRGVYQDEVGEVLVNRLLPNAEEKTITVAHEFGHALGLFHIDTRASVMNSGNILVLPLPADAEALTELWGPCVRNDVPQFTTLQ